MKSAGHCLPACPELCGGLSLSCPCLGPQSHSWATGPDLELSDETLSGVAWTLETGITDTLDIRHSDKIP